MRHYCIQRTVLPFRVIFFNRFITTIILLYFVFDIKYSVMKKRDMKQDTSKTNRISFTVRLTARYSGVILRTPCYHYTVINRYIAASYRCGRLYTPMRQRIPAFILPHLALQPPLQHIPHVLSIPRSPASTTFQSYKLVTHSRDKKTLPGSFTTSFTHRRERGYFMDAFLC